MLEASITINCTRNTYYGSSLATVVCPGSLNNRPLGIATRQSEISKIYNNRRSNVVHAGDNHRSSSIITTVILNCESVLSGLVATVGNYFTGNADNSSAVSTVVSPCCGDNLRPSSITTFKCIVSNFHNDWIGNVVHAGNPCNSRYCSIAASIRYIKGIIDVLSTANDNGITSYTCYGATSAAVISPCGSRSCRPFSITALKHDILQVSNYRWHIIIHHIRFRAGAFA